MGCCCFFCCCRNRESDRKSFNSSDTDIVIVDRHYGCSESGALVALIIILILVLGTIASTIFIKDITLVLICSVVSLVIGAIIFISYCAWQRVHVKQQRAKFGRPYAADTLHRKNGHLYTSVPTSVSTRTSWLFWSTKKNATQVPVVRRTNPPPVVNRKPVQQQHQIVGVPTTGYSTVV